MWYNSPSHLYIYLCNFQNFNVTMDYVKNLYNKSLNDY